MACLFCGDYHFDIVGNKLNVFGDGQEGDVYVAFVNTCGDVWSLKPGAGINEKISF